MAAGSAPSRPRWRRRQQWRPRRWRGGTYGGWVGCSWVDSIIKATRGGVKRMNVQKILQLLDDERPRFAGYGRIVERLDDVTRFHSADGSHHVVVIASGFDPANLDAII